MSAVLLLPPGCVPAFVGEGAANVVFTLGLPDDCKLLRVPKAGTSAFPYAKIQAYWERRVRPLFEADDLVAQSLVRLGGSNDDDLVPKLNQVLAELDARGAAGLTRRRAEFIGNRVATGTTVGMLVEDMRAALPSDIVIEFKPKWLAQSPSAPAGSRRCRNCAREALRASRRKLAKVREGEPNGSAAGDVGDFGAGGRAAIDDAPPPIPLCPLDLLACSSSSGGVNEHEKRDFVKKVVWHLLGPVVLPTTLILNPRAPQWRRLEGWLRDNALLHRLRDAQVVNGCTGFEQLTSQGDGGLTPAAAERAEDDEETAGTSLSLAMTLRDCTCFVRIPADESRPVEAKLGDLDLKNEEAKSSYWRAMERDLIRGGYYLAEESPRRKTDCRLERRAGV